MSWIKKVVFWGVLVLLGGTLSAVTFIVVLFVADRYLAGRFGEPSPELFGKVRFRYQTFYPYSGPHMEANNHHHGPMPWENQDFYSVFDVRSGDHGFFVDFDLDNPPEKQPDEFRVILIGGSGAQGWGGSRNATMFYRLLEDMLNRKMRPATGLRYKVTNLAMGGAVSYQNFIALNTWGHKLRPDAIISYSGGNDFFVPMQTGSDVHVNYYGLAAGVNSIPPSEQPGIFSVIDEKFPALAVYTKLKHYVSLLTGIQISGARRLYLAREKYIQARNFADKDPIFDVALPTYVHALKSIKRDFQGIRMLVMFQAVDWRQAFPFADLEYGQFTGAAEKRLTGYLNDKWYFLNMHSIWKQENLYEKGVMFYGMHLTDYLQAFVTEEVMRQVPLWFWKR